MASPYDALLEETPKQSEGSKYDALLSAGQPSTTPEPAAEKPRSLRESLGRFLGGARDLGTEVVSEFSPELSARVFGQTAASLREEEKAKPLISPETAGKIIGELPTYAGGGTEIGKGIASGAASTLSGFSNPVALASLPAFAVPGVAETYAANVLSDVPKQAEKLGAIAGEHGIASKEFAQAATEAGIVDLTGLAAGLHSPAVKQARLSESLKQIIGGEEPSPLLSDRLPETTLSPEAIAETKPAAEAPRNKNQPVEPDGGSAVAQGDLDALTRSNAERLGSSTEGLPPEMPKAPEEIASAPIEPVVQAAFDQGKTDGVLGQNDRIVTVQKPDGTTYQAVFGDEFYDKEKTRASIAKLTDDGKWSHTVTEKGAKIIEPDAETTTGTEPVEVGGETLGQADVTTPSDAGGGEITGTEAAAVPQDATTSVGPGAASIREPLASYEKRRFGERLQQDESISPELREQTGNRYYEPIPNTTTVSDAAKIIQRRGTDESVRLVRDESFPIEPRVRVTMGEALIKELNKSSEEARAAGNDVHSNEFLQHAVDTAEFLSGYGTTLGQGVQAFAIWNKLSPEGRLLEAQRIAQKSGIELKPEQIERINKFNSEIEKAPEGFQKDEKTQDLLSYMADIKGVKPADIPTALWYSNILSGYSTQLINTVDTALNVFSEAAAMGIANPKAIPNIVAGLYQGMIRGGFEAASVLKTGRSITGDKISQQRISERTKFGQKGGVPMSDATPISRFMKSAFESKPATILNLWKYPLRAMIASDTVFFNSMKEARAQYLARGIAKKEGLSGKALFKRVENELNQSPETIDAATRQAQAEGLTGLNVKRRVSEIIDQGRSEALVSNANEAAEIATYNHDPSGVLGLVAQNIANITEGFPLGKAVVPFTRIVANVANRGLNYTPWGYKRLFFGEWGGKKFASEPPTGDAFKAQLVKATLGTTAMTAVALLDSNDTIQVTAKGPDNPDEAKQLQNAGWKPYSVKIGDTYYSYQYTPMNLGFAMIGHYRDAVRYNKLSEKDAQTRLAYGMLKSGSTIFDMSFLSGISDFVSSVQGNASSTKGAGRLFSRTASSVAIPNLVKQIDKLFDPTIYQADTITQSLIRETPIARSAMLKPMLNVLGESIKPSQNRFFTFDTNDPVWKLITEKQAWVSVPSKTTKVRDRPITPDEYYQLIKESGPMIRDYIESNLGSLQEMSGEEAQKAIRNESNRIRDQVKSSF